MQKNHNNDVSYWKFYVLDKMFSIWIVCERFMLWKIPHELLNI